MSGPRTWRTARHHGHTACRHAAWTPAPAHTLHGRHQVLRPRRATEPARPRGLRARPTPDIRSRLFLGVYPTGLTLPLRSTKPPLSLESVALPGPPPPSRRPPRPARRTQPRLPEGCRWQALQPGPRRTRLRPPLYPRLSLS